MFRPLVRLLWAALYAAVVAATFFVAFALGRLLITGREVNWRAEAVARLEPLLAACAGAALAGAVLAAIAAKRRRRLLAQVEQHLADLRNSPSPNASAVRGGAEAADLADVRREADALAACYRQALAEVVKHKEKLDRVRTWLGQQIEGGEPATAVTPTHLVVASRHRMVARLAPNFHVIAVTAPLRQLLERTNEELTAVSFLTMAHPEDAAALKRSLKEALKDGESHNVEFRVVLKPAGDKPGQARERHLQMDVLTCYDEEGTPQNLRCHFTDVTARVKTERELLRRTREVSDANDQLRQANAALERLKESYRDLYHFAPVVYFSLDAAGNLAVFNETMLRTLGYPREALLNKPYANLLTPEGKAAFQSDPSVLQRAGDVETQWVKQDGTVIDVWIGTTTIRDAATGAFVRSRSVARDVSETKRLENALNQRAVALAKTITHVKRVNQELEEFTYVVSHDLKEPLRTLQAFSNFLAADYGPQLGADGMEHINHLVRASKRLKSLIDDLLILSRTGRVINTPRAFAWQPVLDVVFGDLQELIACKNAQVRVEGPLPPVVGDPERVMQLLINLIGNGLKYNKSARPEVVVGYRGESNGFGEFYVRDNGIGIDPTYHDQIFRIFRRLHHSDEVEGTGADLAICKSIVEAHGGRLRVESEPGKGATFLFSLPRYKGAAKPGSANGTVNRNEVIRAPAGSDQGTALVAGGR
jgi:PAS domain S-box-containing protein